MPTLREIKIAGALHSARNGDLDLFLRLLRSEDVLELPREVLREILLIAADGLSGKLTRRVGRPKKRLGPRSAQEIAQEAVRNIRWHVAANMVDGRQNRKRGAKAEAISKAAAHYGLDEERLAEFIRRGRRFG